MIWLVGFHPLTVLVSLLFMETFSFTLRLCDSLERQLQRRWMRRKLSHWMVADSWHAKVLQTWSILMSISLAISVWCGKTPGVGWWKSTRRDLNAMIKWSSGLSSGCGPYALSVRPNWWSWPLLCKGRCFICMQIIACKDHFILFVVCSAKRPFAPFGVEDLTKISQAICGWYALFLGLQLQFRVFVCGLVFCELSCLESGISMPNARILLEFHGIVI